MRPNNGNLSVVAVFYRFSCFSLYHTRLRECVIKFIFLYIMVKLVMIIITKRHAKLKLRMMTIPGERVIVGRFSALFSKENNLCDCLFTFVYSVTASKKGAIRKDYILFFLTLNHCKKKGKNIFFFIDLSLLQAYPVSLNNIECWHPIHIGVTSREILIAGFSGQGH